MSFLAYVNAFNANPCAETFAPIVQRVSDATPIGDKAAAQSAVADLRAIAYEGFGENAGREFVIPFVREAWTAVRPAITVTVHNRAKVRAKSALAKYA